jgi:hypothetical protein
VSTADELGPLVEVHMLEMPVQVWARSQEHADELFREFALMAGAQRADDDRHGVPARLTELIALLTQQFGGRSADAEDRLYAASQAGEDVIDDLVLSLPAAAAQASKALGEMLDEADEYCRQGRDLLTLATPEELVRFRWWYLDNVGDQIAGKPPVAWSQYRRS